MSDLDVSLRLRLVNQLSRPAEEAERDLKELQAAAERLGRTHGGGQLGQDLDRLGTKAAEAKGKIGAIGSEAAELRNAIGRLNNTGGLDGIKVDANNAKLALGTIKAEAAEVRAAIGRIDDATLTKLDGKAAAAKQAIGTIGDGAGEAKRKIEWLDDSTALDKLKTDAAAAEQAVRDIGSAADQAAGKLDQLGKTDPGRGVRDADRNTHDSRRVTEPRPHDRRRLGREGLEGLADRSGMDALVPIGAGAGYMAGAAIGGAIIAGGSAYKRFAGDDRETEYILMNMGVPQEEGAARRKQVRDIARDTRAPYGRTMEGLDALAATGVPVDDVMKMLPPVMRTSLAANAEPADVARTSFALKQMMGIKPEDMQKALDMVVAGGNLGMFEVPDMARELPKVLTYANQAGFSGLEGLREVIARLQAASEGAGGDNAAAANNLVNIFAKMRSEETERNFKEYGVNLPREFKRGRAAGKDDLDILYEASMKASKGGDPDKLARLFGDMQAFLGLQSLIQQREKYLESREGLEGADGTVDAQWQRVASDPQASLDALSNAANRAAVGLGGFLDSLGLTEGLDAVGTWLDTFSNLPRRGRDFEAAPGIAETVWKWITGESGARNPDRTKDDVVATPSPDRAAGIVVGSGRISDPEGGGAAGAGRPVIDIRHWFGGGDDDGLISGFEGRDQLLGGERGRGTKQPDADAARAISGRFESAFSQDASGSAEETMAGYNDALRAGLETAKGIVQSAVAEMQAMLSFTAGPVIQPTFAPAGGGAPVPATTTPGPQSAVTPAGGSKVALTQHISSPNSQMAARRAQREANRAVRLAQSRALHDGVGLA